MLRHVSEMLSFVRIERNDGSEIWWPALCSSFFSAMIAHLPVKLQAYCTLQRRKMDADANTTWAVLVGRNKPTPEIFHAFSEESLVSSVKEFFVNLDSMERTYQANRAWQQAKMEALLFLDSKMIKFECYNLTCPDGSYTLTDIELFNRAENCVGMKPLQGVEMQHRSLLLEGDDTSTMSNEHCNSGHINDDNENSNMALGSPGGESIVDDSVQTNKTQMQKKSNKKRKKSHVLSNHQEEESLKKKSKSGRAEERESSVSNQEEGSRRSPRLRKLHSSNDKDQKKKSDNQTKIVRKISADDDNMKIRKSPRSKNSEVDRSKRHTEGQLAVRKSPRLKTQANYTFNENDQKSLEKSRKTPSSAQKVTPQKNGNVEERLTMRQVIRRRKKRCIKPQDPWALVMDILLHDYGFYFVKGRGLIAEYYVFNEYDDNDEKVTERYMIDNLKKNIEYFTGEEALKLFVHKKYGWVGEEGKEFEPPSETRHVTKRLTRSEQSTPTKKKATRSKQSSKSTSENTKPKKANGTTKTLVEKVPSPKAGVRNDTRKTRKEQKIESEKEQVKLALGERLLRICENLNEFNNSKDTFYFGSGPESKVAEMNENIMEFLEKSIDSNSNGFMYVCGNPGQGKVSIRERGLCSIYIPIIILTFFHIQTTLVKRCVEAKASTISKTIHNIEITASTLGNSNSSKSLLSQIAKALNKPQDCSIQSLEKLLKNKKSLHLIMILDEIQFLVKYTTICPTLMRILALAADPMYAITVIGISNSVGDDDARLLDSKTKVSQK